jgi:hypothetical protein
MPFLSRNATRSSAPAPTDATAYNINLSLIFSSSSALLTEI